MNNPPFIQLIENLLANPGTALGAFWLMLKAFYLLGFLIYLAFALIVIRQVRLMSHAYQTVANPIFTLLAILHFFLAVGAFLFALLVL